MTIGVERELGRERMQIPGTKTLSAVQEYVQKILKPPYNTTDGEPLKTTFLEREQIPTSMQDSITAFASKISTAIFVLESDDYSPEKKANILDMLDLLPSIPEERDGVLNALNLPTSL